jgi:hypothetical protein
MATLKEMCDVVDSISIDNPLTYGVWPFPLNELKHYLKCVMIDAEDKGRYFNGVYAEYNEPCTYWKVGDYVIMYLTDDLGFHAGMLTEDMMDDLIIERA